LGSPLHPSSEPSPMSSNTQLTGTVSNTSAAGSSTTAGHPPGPNAMSGRRQHGRRQSAYGEQSGQYFNLDQRMQAAQGYGATGPGPSRPMGPGQRERDRDCIVM
jgi:hypothetical protein